MDESLGAGQKSSRRFKSADELRSAVEQVPIKCSWQESKGQNLSSWESEGLAKEIRVSVEVKKGKYRLRVSQSSSSGAPFRAITKLCRSGLNQKEALAAVGHVTRSLISGKRIPDIELKPSKTMK